MCKQRLNCEMLANLLLLLLITVSCEAEQPKLVLETNVYKRGINHSERAEFLHWHNYYRRQVENPSAANMTYLLYHKELETAALDWAVKCNFNHGNFNFTRYQLDAKINIGQNIAARMGTYSIQLAVFRWFDEHSDYSFKDKSCKPGKKCGHYEQVAGAVVTHIGCAIVYCSKYTGSKMIKDNTYNLVCNYYPSAIRGYWYTKSDGKPTRDKLKIYEEGEPCTACPDGYKVCEDKLCRSSPPCLTTLDNECTNPVNTTTCLCDASVYPVYHDSGLSLPSSSVQSSPKQTAASVMKSLPSTITDLPLTKATERAVTAPITSTKTSTVGSTTSQSTRRQTTTRTEILQETTTEIFETISAETVKQISRTQSTSTETRTLEIYTSEITEQITFTQTDDDTALEITDEGSRQHEITASRTVVPDITTRPTLPDITTRPTSPDIATRPTSPDIATRPTSPLTSTIAAAATSSGRFGPGDNMTTAYREPSVSEEMQPMCFIKMSTKYLTQNDMLPKDPGAIGDELFQRRWRQIQSQPKLSLQALQQQQQQVASRAAAALPFPWLSVTMQCFHFMIAAVVCLIMWAFG